MRGVYQPLLAVAWAPLTACAPLVSYDDVRGGVVDAGDAAPASASDAGVDAASPNGCAGVVPGVYCGRLLAAYGGGVQDLVRCLADGGVGPVVACPHGCSQMPDGRQDLCNPCFASADGAFCAQQLVPDYPHDDVLVVCMASAPSSAIYCPKGCVSGACL